MVWYYRDHEFHTAIIASIVLDISIVNMPSSGIKWNKPGELANQTITEWSHGIHYYTGHHSTDISTNRNNS